MFAVRCGARSFLAPHFVVRCSQNHNCTAPYFCGYMCGAVYSLVKTITTPHLIFAITFAVWCIKIHLLYKNSTYISNITIFDSQVYIKHVMKSSTLNKVE